MTSLDELAAALRARPRHAIRREGFAPSAVLALITLDPDDRDLARARLTFTRRPDGLRHHAGQICFPGGRVEPADRDLVGTALRETQEELGVPPERVEVLGLLDDVPTPSRFVITPVVGALRAPFALAAQEAEVAEVFDVELAALRSPGAYHADGVREYEGVRYVMHEYRVGGHRIWGATARMVHQLLELA